jgi:hypothetical protein
MELTHGTNKNYQTHGTNTKWPATVEGRKFLALWGKICGNPPRGPRWTQMEGVPKG